MDDRTSEALTRLREARKAADGLLNPRVPRFPTPQEEAVDEVRSWRAEAAERAERAEKAAQAADERSMLANGLSLASLVVASLALFFSILVGLPTIIPAVAESVAVLFR